MKRCPMTLLVTTMIILALSGGAEAAILRISPVSDSVYVLAATGHTTFQAVFTGLSWPFVWHTAHWYVDDVYAGGQALYDQTYSSTFTYAWSSPGTHTVKVRALYDTSPWGIDDWTGYLTWNVTVVSPDTYTIERGSPVQQTCSGPVHGGSEPRFRADLGGLVSQAYWQEAQWYMDGVLASDDSLTGGQTTQAFFSPRFVGTREIKVRARYTLTEVSVWTDYLTWNATMLSHPPTAACVSPASPATIQAGDALTFTARGSDPGAIPEPLEIAGVRWYLDGVQQGESAVGLYFQPTIDLAWSHTFDTGGTHQVEAVFYDSDGGISAGGQAAWTVTVQVLEHKPSASIVSPGSPVSINAGDSVTFKARGADAASDLRLCEVSLDGAVQTDASFSGSTSGSTAEWTHTFGAAGTYQVKFTPVDLAGNSGSSCTWTVTVDSHEPSVSIVSPGSFVGMDAGTAMTFEARGVDAGADLRHCEVSLDGVPQTNASFSSSASGGTATWTCTFNTPGTYRIEFIPVDLIGYRGTGCTWTVEVQRQVHPPSGILVSPGSPATVLAGAPVTFTLKGADANADLRLCEVSLSGVFQANCDFSGPTSGSIATWTHTFDVPGMYIVAFTPLDSAGDRGSVVTWAVMVYPPIAHAGLNVLVIKLDLYGLPRGPLAGATVDLMRGEQLLDDQLMIGRPYSGVITDGQGRSAFTGVDRGTYTVSVTLPGYYLESRYVELKAGETKDVIVLMMPRSERPAIFLNDAPYKFVITGRGSEQTQTFFFTVVWNGLPGHVWCDGRCGAHVATVTDLGGGKAEARVTLPCHDYPQLCLLTVSATNGAGLGYALMTPLRIQRTIPFVDSWLPDCTSTMGDFLTGEAIRSVMTSVNLANAAANAQMITSMNYDPLAGTIKASVAGSGTYGMTLDRDMVEVPGDARIDITGSLAVVMNGADEPEITPSWAISFTGKQGVGAPLMSLIDTVFPPAAPAVTAVTKVPLVGDALNALKFRTFLTMGGEIRGDYSNPGAGTCFLGSTGLSGNPTMGLEGQVVAKVKRWFVPTDVGAYVSVTGTPEFEICPDLELKGVTLRGYVGVFASAWLWRIARDVGLEMRWGDTGQDNLLHMASEPDLSDAAWEPIGDSCLRWGPTNVLVVGADSGGRLHILSDGDEISEETKLVENVVLVASPAILSRPSEKLILFALQDPNKPWWAATDIGTARQAAGGSWSLDRVANDQAAEFSPRLAGSDSGRTLAAWERVSGDASDVNDPSQIAPHMEIVAAWLDPATGLWSTPEPLTSNTVIDHQPTPIALGTTRGILWVQNEGGAAPGDVGTADRLMLATWSGSRWNEPVALWSPKKSIMGYTFAGDGLGEGHVVLAADGDGDPNTGADCELYRLSTVRGVWQPAIQLTSDFVEDSLPSLVAPNGVPMCAWNADGTLMYARLDDWQPRPVYREYTMANEAPSLDAVTMPGGAAIAYTVQGPNGVDIVASFYDADLDSWSLPRALTRDEAAESSLSLTCDSGELVIAYLKTQTDRTGMDIEIEGQTVYVDNLPQPGRTDLYVLRHSLANDPAVVAQSLVVEPANPAPGTTAKISATVENGGDLPLQDVEVVFYDGDPAKGGVPIADKQVISGLWIAGGKKNVSVSWDVPLGASSHEIWVAVDPRLTVEDKDRSNNALSLRTVLPDLAVETCWTTEVSSTAMALMARVVNKGVIPVGACEVSWRLEAPDGEQIGTETIPSMVAGGAYESIFIWDTTGRLDGGQYAHVFAVVDAAGTTAECDETNNAADLAVFHSAPAPETP